MADIVAATKSGDASAVRAAIAAGEFVNAKDGVRQGRFCETLLPP